MFAPSSTPSQTSLNRILWIITRITLKIELFTALNSFAGAIKTQKLMGAPFLFELLASERSERDTYRGNTIENRGCLFIYLYICLDVRVSFCTLTLAFLC